MLRTHRNNFSSFENIAGNQIVNELDFEKLDDYLKNYHLQINVCLFTLVCLDIYI